VSVRCFLSSLSVVAFFIACSPAKEEEPPVVGVNDVKKACEIRTTWLKRDSDKCRECIAIATNAACECTDRQRAYAGKCHDHHLKRANEPTCSDVTKCIASCTDSCDCIDKCYEGKDQCRTLSAALDGCVAEVCNTEECK